MLPRKLRLSRHQFPDTRGLRRASSPHFSIASGVSPEGGVAVVISKKAARLAVSRHLLKRRILSVLSPYASEERVLVVHVRPGAASIPFSELRDEILSLLSSVPGILPAPKTN